MPCQEGGIEKTKCLHQDVVARLTRKVHRDIRGSKAIVHRLSIITFKDLCETTGPNSSRIPINPPLTWGMKRVPVP